MRLLTLISIITLFFYSCQNMISIEKFNQEAYDEYLLKSSSNSACILSEGNQFHIDMNMPDFNFYQDTNKLNFNTLSDLDTFISNNKTLEEDYRFYLVGKSHVNIGRIDSVILVLQKHKRYRYKLIYQKGFWE